MYKKKRKPLKQRLEELQEAYDSLHHSTLGYIDTIANLYRLLDKSVLRCPKCNDIPTTYIYNEDQKVACPTCGSFSNPQEGWFSNKEDAVKFWNEKAKQIRDRI